jgi:hypothetical protein
MYFSHEFNDYATPKARASNDLFLGEICKISK